MPSPGPQRPEAGDHGATKWVAATAGWDYTVRLFSLHAWAPALGARTTDPTELLSLRGVPRRNQYHIYYKPMVDYNLIDEIGIQEGEVESLIRQCRRRTTRRSGPLR